MVMCGEKKNRFPIPGRDQRFPLLQNLQFGSGAYLAFYPEATENCFARSERPGNKAKNSPPSSSEMNNVFSYNSTPPCAFN